LCIYESVDLVDLVDFLKLAYIMRCITVSNYTACCGLHVCLVVNQQTHICKDAENATRLIEII